MSRGRVKIENNNVVTDRGTPLRGGVAEIYSYGRWTHLTDYATNPAYYRQMRNARLNAVRVVCFDIWQRTHNFPFWDLHDPPQRRRFLHELDRVVDLAEANGLYALIDYHDIGAYDLEYLNLFWDLVAPRYAHRTHVFYELANEPVQWCPENYTDEHLRDFEKVYRRIRAAAPDTHITLLTFANPAKPDRHEHNPMLDVVSRLQGIDWTNASVAVHAYGQLDTRIFTNLRAVVPTLITEIDLPPHAGATWEPHLFVSIDSCEYGIEALERQRLSWFSWGINGPEKLDRNFVRGVLKDAEIKDYLWQPDLPEQKPFGASSAILSYLRDFPVAEMTRRMGMKPAHVAVCTAFACLAAILDGAMLALLIPISRGAGMGNFDFFWSSPIPAALRHYMPAGVGTFTGTFIVLGIVLFCIGLLKNAAQYALHLATAHWYGIYSKQLVSAVFQRYLSFGRTYYLRNDAGRMATTLDYNHDVLNLHQALLRIISTVPILLIHLAVMLVISWRSTVAVVLILVPLNLARRWIARKTTGPLEASQRRTLSIASKAFEVLRAAPLFRSYAKESAAVQSHAAIMEEVRKSDFQVWLYSGLLPRAQDVMTLFGLLTILIFAIAYDHAGSSITVAFVFFFAARLAIPHLSVLHEVELQFAQKMPRVRLFYDIFNDHGKFILPGGKRQFEGIVDSIRFQNLNFAYPDRGLALRDTSFIIWKGKVTALVGPSGSGKSTLAALIMRYHDVAPQTLVFDGVNARQFDTASIRRHIAFVSQDVILLDDTLRNNLTFGCEGEVAPEELARVISDACLDELVGSLPDGLDTRLGTEGLTLSGGQRQRVAIARAMLKRAPILILDEATSALDSLTERQVQVAIENLLRDCTSLVIAHRLSTIQRADHIVVLDSGSVIEQGSVQELLQAKGRFFEMWQAQRFE